MQHGSRKGFSGGSQKIIGVWSDAERASLGAPAPSGVQGQRPAGGPGGKAPGTFLTLLPIFEHGLQFRFNEITYFLEH